MTKSYLLHVKPCDGVTLLSDTKREWATDREFEVVETTYMPFQPGWREKKRGFKFYITRREAMQAVTDYGISFDVSFVSQTVREYLMVRAEDCYATQEMLR